MLEMLSLIYLFATTQAALVEVTPEKPTVECVVPANTTNGFTVVFHATLQKSEKPVCLVDIPGVARVSLSLRSPTDGDMRVNYCSFKMPDGSIPVMYATVFLSSAEHPEWKEMTVGFPLACLQEPYGPHEFVLNFSGVRWALDATAVSATEADAFLVEFTVTPKAVAQGQLSVDLMGDTKKCRFEIDLKSGRAQFASVKADGTADQQKSLRQGCQIQCTWQFAIENLIATDKPFPVKLIVKFDPKSGGSLVDAEIAGCRTMISFWQNLSASKVSFNAKDVELTHVTLAPFK